MSKPSDQTPLIKLKNIGPVCQQQLQSIGVYTAGDIRKLGVERVFEKMIRSRIENEAAISCLNASYLYAMYGAIEGLDWRQIPEEKKDEFKAYTARLRELGN